MGRLTKLHHSITSPYGPELLQSFGFDTSTGWWWQTGWDIIGGLAVSDGIGQNFDPLDILDDGVLEINVDYKWEFDIVHTSGTLLSTLAIGAGALSGFTGHKIYEPVQFDPPGYLFITWAAWVGTIDNVSIKKIL